MRFRERFDDCEVGEAVRLATAVRDGLLDPEEGFELEKVPGESADDFAWVRKY